MLTLPPQTLLVKPKTPVNKVVDTIREVDTKEVDLMPKIDKIQSVVYDAKYAIKRFSVYDLEFPDAGPGVSFWIELRDECLALAESFPDQVDSICSAYDSLWSLWKERRDCTKEES